VILGFRHGANEICVLGDYVAFWDNLSVPPSRLRVQKNSWKWDW